jgi:hypothetical protein
MNQIDFERRPGCRNLDRHQNPDLPVWDHVRVRCREPVD